MVTQGLSHSLSHTFIHFVNGFRRLSAFSSQYETSENEERAIADAIAKEEERMRMDEERGRSATDQFRSSAIADPSLYSYGVTRTRRSPSLPKNDNNTDMKICKQVIL